MAETVSIYQEMFWRHADADAYSTFEHMTSPPAFAMLQQSGIFSTSPDSPLVILDNACGTGIVTCILHECKELQSRQFNVICGDTSPNMVEAAGKRIAEHKWKGAKAEIINAQDTKLPDNHFTHVFTNFGIMLMSEPQAALRESFRILKPAGSLGFTGWKHIGWLAPVREALERIPGSPPFPDIYAMLRRTGSWDEPSFSRQQLVNLGCENVKVELLDFEAAVDSPKIFALSFKAILGQFTQAWSQEDKKKYEPLLVQKLEEVLTEKHGDKPFGLRMGAVVATGVKPN
ncbi:hypothetical protein EW146_g7680 [Bondarzewia mesenterica]|uniref:Methyltransferase type 11 domain-containing protein n=1 Tax=Bondarzewia mesenterica TaxID=1095465 RepID=A0A4S4LKP8_9AGAM|nr:hypothetical protein EW146_g7680 [Bondarzewia mesenterica]